MVWLALAVVGCSHGDDTIDRTFDPCALSITTDPVHAAGITDALALWNLTPTAGDAIEVRFEPAAQSFHGLYDDEHGIVYINEAITDPHVLAIVIAHELGHAFGLPHITDRASLMNRGNLSLEPNDQDVAAVRALWGACEATTSSAAPLRTSRHR